jgi:hypothetical protein
MSTKDEQVPPLTRRMSYPICSTTTPLKSMLTGRHNVDEGKNIQDEEKKGVRTDPIILNMEKPVRFPRFSYVVFIISIFYRTRIIARCLRIIGHV